MLSPLLVEEWKDSHWKVVNTLRYKASKNSSLNLTRQTNCTLFVTLKYAEVKKKKKEREREREC